MARLTVKDIIEGMPEEFTVTHEVIKPITDWQMNQVLGRLKRSDDPSAKDFTPTDWLFLAIENEEHDKYTAMYLLNSDKLTYSDDPYAEWNAHEKPFNVLVASMEVQSRPVVPHVPDGWTLVD